MERRYGGGRGKEGIIGKGEGQKQRPIGQMWSWVF